MRRGYQLALFGTDSGRGRLFEPGTLKQFLGEQSRQRIPDLDEKVRTVESWAKSLRETKATETTLENAFINQIWVRVLGYSTYPTQYDEAASLYVKPGSKLTGIPRTPDALLGQFDDSVFMPVAAVELKSPGVDLDAPQARANAESPVDQAFFYGTRILGTKWVLVSDMRSIRLYSVESDDGYEEVRLDKCVDSFGKPTSEFDKLCFLLHADQLIKGGPNSPVAAIYSRSTSNQLRITEGFYEAYYAIRSDLLSALKDAADHRGLSTTQTQLLEGAQRLLDRLLFMFYCEDHPAQLLPKNTVRDVTHAASRLPGASTNKVYNFLKELFREVDAGSPEGSGAGIQGYNGELFKHHWLIDEIDLPDSLNTRKYAVEGPGGYRRTVSGAWGLHVYDFWAELNEHLLGHIFEQSLSDFEAVDPVGTEVRLKQRKRIGIYYTSSLLSDFLSTSAVQSFLNEHASVTDYEHTDQAELIRKRIESLRNVKVLDLACGSGAFLVSIYRELLFEYWRLRSAEQSIRAATRRGMSTLFEARDAETQAQILRECVAGVDLLPQAVEIAKLALWLRSARRGEKIADLSSNIVCGNSLDVDKTFNTLNADAGSYDIVIGNPPWGAEMEPDLVRSAVSKLGIDQLGFTDSWELFLALGVHALRPGGQLALVLPDSFFYEEKLRVRSFLFRTCTVEKVMNLGPDWFGPQVRMGTMLLQARKGVVANSYSFHGTLLAGKLRSRCVAGEVPLTQIETQRSRVISAERVLKSPQHQIAVFCGDDDERLMNIMIDRGLPLEEICSRSRGEEINKAGLIWTCPSCLSLTVPGKISKGGGYEDKECPSCGLELSEDSATQSFLVSENPINEEGKWVPFIDGDDLNTRYRPIVPSKYFRADVSGWSYKSASQYLGKRILIRQAGVGLFATLVNEHALTPQSVYTYQLMEEYGKRGYETEFLIGALLSRPMAFFILKRFSEVDPAKAHSKLTHARLAVLPIPKVDFGSKTQRRYHDTVVKNVKALYSGSAQVGGKEDGEIDVCLRKLWGLTPEDGAYMNSEFFDLPYGQYVKALFPAGPPEPRIAS